MTLFIVLGALFVLIAIGVIAGIVWADRRVRLEPYYPEWENEPVRHPDLVAQAEEIRRVLNEEA